MGLLDDAIRDHLDLKRRRGADPAEIERAEREALGPVRREPIAADESGETLIDPGDLEGGAHAPSLPPESHGELSPAGERYGGDFEDDELGDDEEWDDYEDDEPDREEEDGFEPSHPDPGPDSSHQAASVSESPSQRPHPPPGPDEDPHATRAYDIHPGEESEEGSDDVLEETPDFLQDTPEHDRLWFEQRPPKDFDFDE